MTELRESGYENLHDTHVETSAKTGDNADQVFEIATKAVLGNRFMPHEVSLPKGSANTPKQQLINDLEKYIQRVESHRNSVMETPNFSYGFWHHKNSRALNREANYYLAKQLLSDLKFPGNEIKTVFADIDGQREAIITERGLRGRPDYKSRGNNSSELKAIIDKAKRMCGSEEHMPLISARQIIF